MNQDTTATSALVDEPTHALVRKIPRSYVGYYARQGRTVFASRADEEHQEYVRALEKSGLTVSFVEADEGLPDCVFIEDTAVIWNQRALITRMCQDREGEQAAVETVLRRTHLISRLADDATLDGGDVLHVGATTYVGLSRRTNEAGAESLKAFFAQFRRSVITVPVTNCLHLKSGVTYLGNGTLLALPACFDMGRFEVEEILYTDANERGSANCLRVRDHLLIPDGYPGTALRLQEFAEKHGVDIKRLDISEFEKGDGSLTCLSLIW